MGVLDPGPPPVEPDPCAMGLQGAVDALLGQDPASLPGPVARERCRTLLLRNGRRIDQNGWDTDT